MIRKILPLVLCLMAVITVAAPKKDLKQFMVNGNVVDNEWNELDSVTVTLTVNDTTTVPFKLLTGDNATRMLDGNQFRLLVERGMGRYQLTLYKEGYETVTKEFTIASLSQDLINMYWVQMRPEKTIHRELDEVTVQATRIKMYMNGDTVVYDASAFKLAEGSMLDDLVRQLPNATLNANGEMTVNGRKVNELLLNGKDFFKGNPQMALKNLPAYTVKNIKVYDKAADDAYLTHSDARLNTDIEAENLVIDVNLKREYLKGTMASIEGGYGTGNHYLGRAFGMGYTDKLRFSLFGNANNTANHSKVSGEGDWYDWSSAQNPSDIVIAGASYDYDDSKRIKAGGSVSYELENTRINSATSQTLFYPGTDLYRRKTITGMERPMTLRTNHNFQFKWDNVMLQVLPGFEYRRLSNSSLTRTATLDAEPEEQYRGAVIDSIFGLDPLGSSCYQSMLTALTNRLRNQSSVYSASLYANTTIRPASWRGLMKVNFNGSYSNSTQRDISLYDQTLGPSAPAGTLPIHRNQYTPGGDNSASGTASVRYERDYRTFGAHTTRSIGYSVSGEGRAERKHNDLSLWLSADSVINPPHLTVGSLGAMFLDPSNSRDTRDAVYYGSLQQSFNFSTQPTTPGDSSINASFNMSLRLSEKIQRNTLEYGRGEAAPKTYARNTFLPGVSLTTGFNSRNKVRQIYSYLSYNFDKEPVSLTNYVVDQLSTSPTDIYLGADGSLKPTLSHRAFFYVAYWSLKRVHANRLSVNGSFDYKTDKVTGAEIYDAATGITTHKPMNVSGDWTGNLSLTGSQSFGPGDVWTADAYVAARYSNSEYYQTLDQDPVQCSVRTFRLTPGATMTYKLPGGSTIDAGYDLTMYRNSGSANLRMPDNALQHCGSVNMNLILPWDLKMNVHYKIYARRGFQDNVLNTTYSVLNADISRQFGAWGFKLNGSDLLNRTNNVSRTVDARALTETWREVLPRYVMLSVSYRFNMSAKDDQKIGVVVVN